MRDRLDDAAHDVVHLAVDDHRVEAFLAAEVLVDDRLGDLGALGDLLDRGRLVAALGEDRAADLDELGTALASPDSRRFDSCASSYYASVGYASVTDDHLRSAHRFAE